MTPLGIFLASKKGARQFKQTEGLLLRVGAKFTYTGGGDALGDNSGVPNSDLIYVITAGRLGDYMRAINQASFLSPHTGGGRASQHPATHPGSGVGARCPEGSPKLGV